MARLGSGFGSRPVPKLRPRKLRARGVGVALAAALFAATTAGCGGDAPASTAASPLVTVAPGLSAPAGTTARVVVDGPEHVASLARDGQGRLWLGTAATDGSPTDGVYAVPAEGGPPTAVVRGLSAVLGLRWVDQTLYVASSTGVDAFSGFDGTGFAERHPVLEVPEGTGEVNGLTSTADGRLWLGISAPCDHCTPSSELSASVVSFLPDGSDRRVEASGIRAPVGLTTDLASGDVLVTMNQRDDLGDATPGDWLAVVRSGQDWGFPDCYGQGGAGCGAVPAPLATLDAHAAVSGVVILDDGTAGGSTAGGSIAGGSTAGGTAGGGRSALVAEWAFGKVQRVTLDDAASGAAGTVTTFLSGEIAPVALLGEPGGAVLVGDWTTGKVYEVRSG